MVGFYLVMCLQLITSQWHALSHQLHYTKSLCVTTELLPHGELRRCRCMPYVVILEQRGDD